MCVSLDGWTDSWMDYGGQTAGCVLVWMDRQLMLLLDYDGLVVCDLLLYKDFGKRKNKHFLYVGEDIETKGMFEMLKI